MAAEATSTGDATAAAAAAALAADFPADVFPLHRLQQPKTALPLAVLVLCGSFSPVTYMHVRALEVARDELQCRRALCEVVGGYLSPVHAAYGKASLRAVTCDERVRMCQLATADSCWLACSSWELQPARGGRWTPTAETLHAYSAWLNACGVYPKARGPVRVILVAGADVVESFATPKLWSPAHLRAITRAHGLAIIPRPGSSAAKGLAAAGIDAKLLAAPSAAAGGISGGDAALVVAVDTGGVESSVSSTAVRDAAAAGRALKYLVPDAVAALILDAGLYAPPCACGTGGAAAPYGGAHRPGCVRAHVMRHNYRALRSRL